MGVNVYQIVTDRIIAELENGIIPWEKPWTGVRSGAYSRATTSAARDFGFQAAFTCEEKVNMLDRSEGELLRLGRFNRPHGADGEKIFEIWEENC